jgi:ribose transport system ATP-binding protein
LLRSLAARGKAIVLVSSDTPELVHLCDRVAVFREGEIVVTLDDANLDEAAIVAAAMGADAAAAAA